MAIKMTITRIKKGYIKAINTNLENYPYEIRLSRSVDAATLSYTIQGEMIEYRFKSLNMLPLQIRELHAKMHVMRFERKVQRYLDRMEW